MTHTYNVSGMTCGGCQAKVQKLLSGIAGVENVSIDLPTGETTIEMANHISTSRLKESLKEYPKYQLEEKQEMPHMPPLIADEETKTWIETYKPLLVIFAYIIGITVSIEISGGVFMWETWMQNFMAGFFFSIFFF